MAQRGDAGTVILVAFVALLMGALVWVFFNNSQVQQMRPTEEAVQVSGKVVPIGHSEVCLKTEPLCFYYPSTSWKVSSHQQGDSATTDVLYPEKLTLVSLAKREYQGNDLEEGVVNIVVGKAQSDDEAIRELTSNSNGNELNPVYKLDSLDLELGEKLSDRVQLYQGVQNTTKGAFTIVTGLTHARSKDIYSDSWLGAQQDLTEHNRWVKVFNNHTVMVQGYAGALSEDGQFATTAEQARINAEGQTGKDLRAIIASIHLKE